MQMQELELFVSNWPKNQKYVIFGAGEKFEAYYDIAIKYINILYVVDNDLKKKNTKINGIEIKDISEISKKNIKIITTISNLTGLDKIKKQLENIGYQEDISYTSMKKFLGIHYFLENRKLWAGNISLMITSKCTLNCKDCCLLLPYNKQKTHFKKHEIIESINNFFHIYGYVSQLHIIGGEPLIHPDINDILDYIGFNYKDKIRKIKIITSGVAKLKKETLFICKKFGIEFTISNYQDQISAKQNLLVDDLIKNLSLYKINFKLQKIFSSEKNWLAMADPNNLKLESKSETKKRFEDCKLDCRLIYDNKLYFCGVGASMVMAGIINDSKKDFIDLKESISKKFIDFDCGNIEFLDSCSRCNGFGKSNNFYVFPGIQK